MKKFILLILYIFLTNSVYGDALPDVKATTHLAQKVMQKIGQSDFDGVSALLKKFWPLPAQEIDTAIYQMKQQQPLINKRFGLPLASEKICVQELGSSWHRVIYFQKYERHTLLWQFDFYKPKDTWLVNAFSYNDKWQSLFGAKCSP